MKSVVVPDQVRGYPVKEAQIIYDEFKAILYALGVGFSEDPLNAEELSFTYELAETFKVVPTFGGLLGSIRDQIDAIASCPGLPHFNPMLALHGEQHVELFEPLPPSQVVTVRGIIDDIADKDTGTLVTIVSTVTGSSGQAICRITNKYFIRQLTGFHDKGRRTDKFPSPPNRAPDKVSYDLTRPNLAILYRLNGSTNPLHIDPNVAALVKFERPILHGLCYLGVGGRAVLREFCKYDVTKFRAIKARFTSHVFPGETIVTEMWKESNRIIFRQRTQERGRQCLLGYVDLALESRSKL